MHKSNQVKVLGIIPARGGSTRIPRKNIVRVGGKPLIYYSIREAKKSQLLDAFIVSTDDPEIAEVARSHGADVPFVRPKSTAKKYSAEIEYQQHALRWLEKNRGWRPELVVLLKPTSPLRPARLIDEVVLFWKQNPHFSMITTISAPPFHPYRMVTRDGKGNALKLILPDMVTKSDFSRWGMYTPSQKLPPVYALNTLVDAIPAKNIMKGTRAVFAGPIGGVLTDPSLCVDIDNEDDLKQAGNLLRLNRRT